MEGYAAFLKGDYDGSVRKLNAAIEEAGSGEPTAAAAAKELQGLATEARDAVKDHREERSAHFLMRYPAEDAVLVPYALRGAGVGVHGAAPGPGLRGGDPDPHRDLPQPVGPGGGLVAVAGRGRAHGHDRAVQVGAPDGDHAARAGLRLPVARQHEPRAGALRGLVADRRPRAGLAAGGAGEVSRAALARAGGRAAGAVDGAPAGARAAHRQADQLRCHAPVDGEAAVGRGRDAGLRRGGERGRVPALAGRDAGAARGDQEGRRRRRRAHGGRRRRRAAAGPTSSAAGARS